MDMFMSRPNRWPRDGENAVDQNTQHRSGCSAEHEFWQQDSPPLSFWERLVATSVFSFISAWNDFLFANSFIISDTSIRAAAAGLRTGRRGKGLM
ncbi:hypothetical protein AQJ91_25220 [Streptomyces dysideae]|uniref:Uncharacterized protein n=1 Tax=Streptomyces dysideae TaxID=909626 RepID=A0A124IEH4_9ACTN|nr:hypothetical protein AQJ91_25220 [Streptomyces dysideae]